MTLIRVWNPDFDACGITPDGGGEQTNPAPISTIIAQDTGTHDVLKKYVPVKCHKGANKGYCSVGWAAGHKRIWRDRNHAQRALLYNCFVFSPTASSILTDIIPSPSRSIGLGVNVNSLQLAGAELRFEVSYNNLELPQRATIQMLCQLFDENALDGHGVSVNYILAENPSIDRVMGFTPPYYRSGAEFKSGQSAWFPYTAKCSTDLSKLIPLDGRPDKKANQIYGVSNNVEDLWNGVLLNFQLVIMTQFKTSTFSGETVTSTPAYADVPALEPLTKSGGGHGQIYLRNVELWVDDALNPNAVEV